MIRVPVFQSYRCQRRPYDRYVYVTGIENYLTIPVSVLSGSKEDFAMAITELPVSNKASRLLDRGVTGVKESITIAISVTGVKIGITVTMATLPV